MPALQITDDAPLRRLLHGPAILDALHAGAQVRAAAAAGEVGVEPLLDAFASGDPLARLLLLSALAQTRHPDADAVLCSALEGQDPAEREHAAWALGERGPLAGADAGLQALRRAGGFGAMLAELTLDRWSEPGTSPPPARPAPRRSGLRIVQIYLPGFLDAGLQRAGAGDGGGLATLLVHLSAALAAHPAVAEVTTLTRAFSGPGIPDVHDTLREPVTAGAAIERIRFGGDGYLAAPDLWPHRRELEHALEAALTRLAPIDAVHLRFADVATLAAERVCRRLGLPVYFTLAPDPHGVIRGREAGGELDRGSFVEADLAEHLIFRARLVEHMRDHAHGLALLPRASGRAELQTLVGLPADRRLRVRTVSEGISTVPVDRAGGAPAVQDLVDRIRSLPPARHGRPLILSVGRLHPVKGFPALVDAWAGDAELRETYNLVILGGDHEHPTQQEQLVLGQLSLAVGKHPAAAGGFVLVGHRPHRDVLALMAAARAGVPGVIGPDGVYACASVKEEFGLALLEAMASGLSVLGPASGGPPTYIDDGVTGVLTDTGSVAGLRAGLRRAGAVRADAERAARATAKVREQFTIEAMAHGLIDLYTA